MNDGRGWKPGTPLSGQPGAVSAEQAGRAQHRAEERERRASERMAIAQARTDRRTAEREQAARERHEMREARRLDDSERLKALRPDPAAPASERVSPGAIPRRRKARTGEPKVERDTRHYRTVIDTDRMLELSQRGASVSSLAAVFGISPEEVEAALAESGPC